MTITTIVLLVVPVLIILYLLKPRFRHGTRVVYIAVKKREDRYASPDAFWHSKYFSKRGLPSSFLSFVPVVPNTKKIKDMKFIATGYIKRKVFLTSKKRISEIKTLEPKYRTSTSEHINIKFDSRRIGEEVYVEDNYAELEYGEKYIIIFEDGSGYAIKLRERHS